MKVNIGPYIYYLGPFQLAEKLCFWVKKYDSKYNYTKAYERVYSMGEYFSTIKWLTKTLEWIDSKRNRKIKVKIHDYDTWSADCTLALIILPTLKLLKTGKHGAPRVEDSDVPANLWAAKDLTPRNDWELDQFFFARWDFVIDEMIWAFEQLQPDYDWAAQFYSGNSDISWKPCADGSTELVYGPNHTQTVDEDAMTQHSNRIDNGLRLFGKYYRNLWD